MAARIILPAEKNRFDTGCPNLDTGYYNDSDPHLIQHPETSIQHQYMEWQLKRFTREMVEDLEAFLPILKDKDHQWIPQPDQMTVMKDIYEEHRKN